ncbi:MAG TPA: pyridoxal phosphate-dependent aminotransferase [Fimbriimonadaceae bacterium]|nr:pyridoxal phosphate-dependent aminotransferase [Fimbriimonadaceae bacterium]
MTGPTLAQRSGIARPSPTLAITAKANQMKADGFDVISFGAGEPDFNTPQPICNAAIAAIRDGFTKYTPSAGIKPLREAIAQKLARENNVNVSPDQIVVSVGGKHCLFNSMQMVVEPGDEVILLAPYWMTYYDQVKLAHGLPVVVLGNPGRCYEPDLAKVEAAISDKTKAIVVNSPCNPTGAVYSHDTIRGLAALAEKYNLWIICDEIYERLTYDGSTHLSVASLSPEIADRTIMIGGCSKTYSMTGWRIGFTATRLDLAKAISNFQDQVTSNPTSIAQKAAIAAFQMGPEEIEAMRSEFETRRSIASSELHKIAGLSVPDPRGAFYFFLDVRPFLGGTVKTDIDLANHLLDHAHVAMVPGSVFDCPGHLRLSYTASKDDIVRGIARIGENLSTLRA